MISDWQASGCPHRNNNCTDLSLRAWGGISSLINSLLNDLNADTCPLISCATYWCLNSYLQPQGNDQYVPYFGSSESKFGRHLDFCPTHPCPGILRWLPERDGLVRCLMHFFTLAFRCQQLSLSPIFTLLGVDAHWLLDGVNFWVTCVLAFWKHGQLCQSSPHVFWRNVRGLLLIVQRCI